MTGNFWLVFLGGFVPDVDPSYNYMNETRAVNAGLARRAVGVSIRSDRDHVLTCPGPDNQRQMVSCCPVTNLLHFRFPDYR